MTCESEYSLVCLSSSKDHQWFWILLPIVLLIICLLYAFCRSDYTRLSSHTYERIRSTKNNIRLKLPKQRNYAFNRRTKYSIPSSSSRFIFAQCKERTKENNNDLLHSNNRTYKTSAFFCYFIRYYRT